MKTALTLGVGILSDGEIKYNFTHMGSASWFDISRQSKRRYRFPMPQNGETEDFPSWLSSMMRQSDQSPLGTDLWYDKLIIKSYCLEYTIVH